MTNSLVISVHDYRSRRKASVHFITSELAKRGRTRFFSIGLSRLSEHRGDTRTDLAPRANRVEVFDHVECFLWRTSWHPFNLRRPALARVEESMFWLYRRLIPRIPRQWLREADTIFIESGMAPVFIEDARRLNPTARIIYLASDDLDVVDCAETIKRRFRANFDSIDTVRLPSRLLRDGMPHERSSVFVPQGIDRSLAQRRYVDPYGTRRGCVSVGSMLFDATFFSTAAAAFPDIDFHIIGAGKAAAGLSAPNIIVHDEMPFEQTLPFVQHAAFGVAPYLDRQTPRYLLDTSLKLRQFGLFGIPAVCPEFARGDQPGRYGYVPGDPASIARAVDAALAHNTPIDTPMLGWDEVVDRIMTPHAYSDTRI
ncbi:polysaccharide biosynthesis protein GumK [Gluconacetobacter azotocaptans]|uniref:GumK N-terminal domain-containing glycosyltransferase n=1 Tax=Gluconacetobacter azotocaptans TaxID=142834 RepID=UPI001958D5E6|nr:polysaccharide biosynthesis protein GumK [Gluconacetobacter azotocaptans]MBM9400242.1 polysaccharide biosynthesis protein GumK [Gluconacetobacter azotocaptans]